MAMKKGCFWTNKSKFGLSFSAIKDRTTTSPYEIIDKPRISIKKSV